MRGVLAHGAYVPYHRLDRSAITAVTAPGAEPAHFNTTSSTGWASARPVAREGPGRSQR